MTDPFLAWFTDPQPTDSRARLLHGDCRDVLRRLPENTFHACVCDPPYGLEFMGKEWDSFKSEGGWQAGGGFSKPGIGDRETPWPSHSATGRYGAANPTCGACGGRLRGKKKCHCEAPQWKHIGKRRHAENEGLPSEMTGGMARHLSAYQTWCGQWAREVYRVLKPGAFILCFGGSRTSHRLACALEDAGFELRDTITWVYGTGFPKSLQLGKAIDRHLGAEREVTGIEHRQGRVNGIMGEAVVIERELTVPATPAAKEWEGWGTALKPATEPILVARKPLTGSVAKNVLRHGTGGLNVDACRVPTDDRWEATGVQSGAGVALAGSVDGSLNVSVSETHPEGRWPTNLVMSHGPDCAEEGCGATCPVRLLDEQSGEGRSPLPGSFQREKSSRGWKGGSFGQSRAEDHPPTGIEKPGYGDEGGASRFFPTFDYEAPFLYVAKPARTERDAGCDTLPDSTRKRVNPGGLEHDPKWAPVQAKNVHPTVKPLSLCRWLVRLVTPPGGLLLDPFLGSGTTGMAALWEGMRCVGIDQSDEYLKIAGARMRHAVGARHLVREGREVRERRERERAGQQTLDFSEAAGV